VISQFLLWMNDVLFLAGKKRVNPIVFSREKMFGNFIILQTVANPHKLSTHGC